MLTFKRMGAFYECLGDGAPEAARVLKIRCTTLQNGWPICGFPLSSAAEMFAKLDRAGIAYTREEAEA